MLASESGTDGGIGLVPFRKSWLSMMHVYSESGKVAIAKETCECTDWISSAF